MSRELQISCNQQVVRNIMSGRQTQDRRPMKVQPCGYDPVMIDGFAEFHCDIHNEESEHIHKVKAPWQVGDLLWVRERVRLVSVVTDSPCIKARFRYISDMVSTDFIKMPERIKPIKLGNCCPNGCFKELARTWLRVKRVWCERVQDISEDDAKEDGAEYDRDLAKYGKIFNGMYDSYDCMNCGRIYQIPGDADMCCHYKMAFEDLINSIYPGIWEENKWMWCREFEEVEKP